MVRQKIISRADLRANPDALYLFGDDCQRRGAGGLARELRGEPNAAGVRTWWGRGHEPSPFFCDADFRAAETMIEADLAPAARHLLRGAILIVPLDGLGANEAALAANAPQIDRWLQARLMTLGRSGG